MIADPKKLDEKLKRLDESDFEEGTSLLEDSARKFKKNKMAVFGCFMITFLFLLSLFAKLVTPYSYDEGKLENQNFPPTWYKSRTYRSRVVHEPRAVLEEFGTKIPSNKEVKVHDSNADMRYLILPQRPKGTEGWNEKELTQLISRDHLVGVRIPENVI